MGRGKIERTLEKDVFLYRSIDPALSNRARPGKHEDADETPQMV